MSSKRKSPPNKFESVGGEGGVGVDVGVGVVVGREGHVRLPFSSEFVAQHQKQDHLKHIFETISNTSAATDTQSNSIMPYIHHLNEQQNSLQAAVAIAVAAQKQQQQQHETDYVDPPTHQHSQHQQNHLHQPHQQHHQNWELFNSATDTYLPKISSSIVIGDSYHSDNHEQFISPATIDSGNIVVEEFGGQFASDYKMPKSGGSEERYDTSSNGTIDDTMERRNSENDCDDISKDTASCINNVAECKDTDNHYQQHQTDDEDGMMLDHEGDNNVLNGGDDDEDDKEHVGEGEGEGGGDSDGEEGEGSVDGKCEDDGAVDGDGDIEVEDDGHQGEGDSEGVGMDDCENDGELTLHMDLEDIQNVTEINVQNDEQPIENMSLKKDFSTLKTGFNSESDDCASSPPQKRSKSNTKIKSNFSASINKSNSKGKNNNNNSNSNNNNNYNPCSINNNINKLYLKNYSSEVIQCQQQQQQNPDNETTALDETPCNKPNMSAIATSTSTTATSLTATSTSSSSTSSTMHADMDTKETESTTILQEIKTETDEFVASGECQSQQQQQQQRQVQNFANDNFQKEKSDSDYCYESNPNASESVIENRNSANNNNKINQQELSLLQDFCNSSFININKQQNRQQQQHKSQQQLQTNDQQQPQQRQRNNETCLNSLEHSRYSKGNYYNNNYHNNNNNNNNNSSSGFYGNAISGSSNTKRSMDDVVKRLTHKMQSNSLDMRQSGSSSPTSVNLRENMSPSPNSLLSNLDYNVELSGTGTIHDKERKLTEMIRQLQIIRERLLTQDKAHVPKVRHRHFGNLLTRIQYRSQRDKKQGTITLDQKKYTEQIIDKFNMNDCYPVKNPVDSNQKLTKDMTAITLDETKEIQNIPYQEAVGSLLYLSVCTRSDISFAVGNVSRFNNEFGKSHWNAVKRIFKYLRGTTDYKLQFSRDGNQSLIGFSDADWASDIESRKSCTGYLFKLQGGAVSWTSKRQPTIALSSAEAEYMALSSATQEAIWLKQLLQEIGENIDSVEIHCDNKSAINIAHNQQYSPRTKHIDIRHHFIKEKITDGLVTVKYLNTENMVADSLTKGVTNDKYNFCLENMGLTR